MELEQIRMSRPSIKHVAQAAGVSTMTVSRVLRNQGGSQFEEQVLAAVRELDYVPVRSAIQNRHVKTSVIGALLDSEFVLESAIGHQTFDGLRRAAFQENYDLLLLHPQHHLPIERQKIPFLDRRCDGFIFVVPAENAEILELLVKHEFPSVMCYSTDVPDGVAYVVPDNCDAIEQGIKLLLDRGHRRIAFWGAPQGHSDARERFGTYESQMNARGLQNFSFDTTHDLHKSPTDAAGGILDFVLQKNITAVLCHNDERAIALWNAATERGLSIPEQLSLIGIDDMPIAATRGLTTFVNPFLDIGWNATQSLLAMLQGDSAQNVCKRLPMTLIERDSVAAPKNV